MQSIKYYLTHINATLGSVLGRMPYLYHNDEKYLARLFRLKIGQPLNLDNPQRFNEKLQWLKLYDHNPQYTEMVDKYSVKQIVRRQIGEQYIIPTIGVWETVEEIDWDVLPNQFVLKTTHGGGGVGVVICKDKKQFDKKKAIIKLGHSMGISGYNWLKEWPYKDVKRRIIAEQYIEDSGNHQLVDYKFHCFNGQPKIVLVCQNRYTNTGANKDFYDMDWNHLAISREMNRNSDVLLQCPEEFLEMKRIAEELSKGIPFVRIDLYLANHQVLFGEYTFYPASGFSPFFPDEWDFTLGEWLELPKQKRI